MDNLEKKLRQLPDELRKEVEDFVDLLILKYERQGKKLEDLTKDDPKKPQIIEKTQQETPVTSEAAEPPTPPPVKRSMAFTRVELMGNSQFTSYTSQKTGSPNVNAEEKLSDPSKPSNNASKISNTNQNPVEKGNTNALNTEKNDFSSSEANKPKSEMLGEREIEVERQLFPCPYCSNVVQDNWDECPFCNKPLKKQAGPAPVAKKKWFK